MSLKNLKKDLDGKMIIGISGKSGSGKSSAARYLEKELGYKRVDLDEISKSIRKEYQQEIIELVNNKSVLISDEIDSKLLGNILFNNKELMDKYNEFIYVKLKEKISEYVSKYSHLIIDSIFLPIMDEFKLCDFKILIECDEQKRQERIIKRDKITIEYLKQREKNGYEYNKNDYDYVFFNDDNFLNNLKELSIKIKHI